MSNNKREQAVKQWKQSGGLADEYRFILKVSLSIMSSACIVQIIMLKIADQYVFTYLPYTILPVFVIAFGFLLPPRKYLAESMMLLIQWSTLAAYLYLFFVKTDHYYREAVASSVN